MTNETVMNGTVANDTVTSAGRVRPNFQYSRWLPIVAMMLLITLLGAYTNNEDASFLSSFNLNGVMIATLPLALAAMGQTSALMVKAFDVSVGALMTLCLVVASFVLGPDESWPSLLLGMLFVIAVALGVGAVNVILIRWLKLSSIIATLATYSALQGVCLWLRPIAEGPISFDFIDKLLYSIGFMPVALIVLAVIAVAADIWLYRSPGGLAARAMGLDEEAAARRGVRVAYLFVRAFFITAFAAALGGLFLAAQVQVGDPNAGFSFTLTSIAAAVLGGASLLGGRGSFVGAVVGALFLNVIINILPYLGWSASYGQIAVGLLTLVALSFYQAPELLRRAKTSIANFRLTRGGSGVLADER
ncbi:MAG TPA: ABC transporter permease [Ilumatobacter sp.]|jgi:ribose transport system ATP-binding protein|nr:ABC transporter permease [Ilumatobacter sp.]